MRHYPALSILALVTLVSACDPASGRLCDERAVSSVTVNVGSMFDEPVESPAVFFRALGTSDRAADIDPGPFQACDQDGETFSCGFELSGSIQIQVEADGYLDTERVVDIDEGACHVIPQHLDIELEPESCTLEAAASVVLSLVDQEGERISGAWANWAPFDADAMAQPCERVNNHLVCGWEQQGTLEIEAGADGFVPWLGTVDVEADECHVSTRYIEVVLQEDDVPCDQEVRPSIVVVVIDYWGNPVPQAETYFVPHLKPLEPWACTSTNNGRFFCGEEQPGEFDVLIRAAGYYNWNRTVDVPADICHVETQYIEARLQEWGPIDG